MVCTTAITSWYQTQFDAFTKATGVKVQYVEGGSGAIVERLSKERSNPQADVLVTLPPFIQRAAAEKLLQDFTPQDAAQIADAQPQFVPLVNNYLSFIYNAKLLPQAPRQLSTTAGTRNSAISCSTPRRVRRVTAPR
ncbi:Iron(III)-binding periplasmic protein [Serratia marcescens]|uniref:Iron(III)-binding periplasmic protein n=1 Tax=Serratia marcescens TaxID=615 RepID=A0A379ZSW4_SERMA|nr:Iron(III)-binding periplasmic protein [Serratia marcescens]